MLALYSNQGGPRQYTQPWKPDWDTGISGS